MGLVIFVWGHAKSTYGANKDKEATFVRPFFYPHFTRTHTCEHHTWYLSLAPLAVLVSKFSGGVKKMWISVFWCENHEFCVFRCKKVWNWCVFGVGWKWCWCQKNDKFQVWPMPWTTFGHSTLLNMVLWWTTKLRPIVGLFSPFLDQVEWCCQDWRREILSSYLFSVELDYVATGTESWIMWWLIAWPMLLVPRSEGCTLFKLSIRSH